MKKYNSINKQLVTKYVSIIVIATIFFIGMGTVVAKNIVLSNSQDLLKNFALQVGKDINEIIQLEIDKVEIISEMPIMSDESVSKEEKLRALAGIVKEHNYKNLKQYAIVSIFFLIGIIAGVIFVNYVQIETYKSNTYLKYTKNNI